jgi:hypothetical protein
MKQQLFLVKMDLDLSEVLVNADKVQPIELDKHRPLFHQQQEKQIC